MEGAVDLIEKLHNEVEMVNEFCYLGDRLNSLVVVKQQSQQE